MSVLTFRGNLNIAIVKVRKQYPDYELWEVIASTQDGSPTNNPRRLTKITVRLRNSNSDAVAIDSNIDEGDTWGSWGQPYEESGGVGYDNITWPFNLDLKEAYQLLVEAGYNDPFSTLNINHPGRKEPCYIFGTTGGAICVGINDNKVWVRNAAEESEETST